VLKKLNGGKIMKKAIKLATFLVAFSILALNVCAFTTTGGGDVDLGDFTVEIINSKAVPAGAVTVTVTGGVVFKDAVALRAGDLVAGNPANGKVGIASLNAPEGVAIAGLLFEATAAGAYTITLVGDEDYEGITQTISGVVGGGEDFVAPPTPDEPVVVTPPAIGGQEPDENVKAGVALVIAPALVAGVALALTRKRK